MIVKNEEQFLDQCLAALDGVAHQIVVVDTGSTDRTVQSPRPTGPKYIISIGAMISPPPAISRSSMLEVIGCWCWMRTRCSLPKV